MADILEQIAEHNQKIYLEKKLEVSLSKVMDMAYAASGTDFAFEKTLGTEGTLSVSVRRLHLPRA